MNDVTCSPGNPCADGCQGCESEPEPLHCPFCGAPAGEVIHHHNPQRNEDGSVTERRSVQCSNMYKGCMAAGDICDSQNAAIHAWNRRVPALCEHILAPQRKETTMANEPRRLPISITDMLETISNYAKSYCSDEHCGVKSIVRNEHMNSLTNIETKSLTPDIVNAVVVDFINYIGTSNCVDYAMYTRDLKD